MTHDMSIHIFGIGDQLSARDFVHYLAEWGCTPLRPEGDTRLLICMRESGGYTESWRVAATLPDGLGGSEIQVLERVA